MKRNTPKTVSEIIGMTREMLAGDSGEHVKQASVDEKPKFASPEGDALRAHAAKLRNFDFSQLKLAGIQRVLDGDMPTAEQIQELQEKGAEFTVEQGVTPADTLRNVAGQLREIGSHIKTAAHVEGFKTVRAYVAAERLAQHLDA